MLIVKSVKWTVLDGSVKSGNWKMILHRVVDEDIDPQTNKIQTIYIEFLDTESGITSKYAFTRYSELIETLVSLAPYGFVETDGMQYRGDFLIVIDKLSLDFIEYVSAVKLVEMKLGVRPALDQAIQDSIVSFCQLDKHGTLFAADSFNGTFACTLLNAICLSSRVFIGSSIYIPFTKSHISYKSLTYQAFRIDISNMRLAKKCLAKALTLRGTKEELEQRY